MPARAVIRDTSLRDGLQSVQTIVPTSSKLDWLDGLYEAGLREIEVGSFVPARLLPQMADTAEIVKHALTLPGLTVSVLVPNLRGAEMALAAGAHLITVPASASVAHSQANLRKSPEEVVAEVARICAARDAAGSSALIEGGVGTAFGCTLQGHVDEADVLALAAALLDAGVDRISLADTVGFADPEHVRTLFGKVIALSGDRFWSAHFHDTRGLALANVYAAMQSGVSRFDGCIAGIGGCPYAPGASGNAATEDMHYMLTSMGADTGLSIERLMALRTRIETWLSGEQLHGVLWKAGVPRTFREASANLVQEKCA